MTQHYPGCPCADCFLQPYEEEDPAEEEGWEHKEDENDG